MVRCTGLCVAGDTDVRESWRCAGPRTTPRSSAAGHPRLQLWSCVSAMRAWALPRNAAALALNNEALSLIVLGLSGAGNILLVLVPCTLHIGCSCQQCSSRTRRIASWFSNIPKRISFAKVSVPVRHYSIGPTAHVSQSRTIDTAPYNRTGTSKSPVAWSSKDEHECVAQKRALGPGMNTPSTCPCLHRTAAAARPLHPPHQLHPFVPD